MLPVAVTVDSAQDGSCANQRTVEADRGALRNVACKSYSKRNAARWTKYVTDFRQIRLSLLTL